ncbi:MAG: hypothetical protein ACI4TK_05900 [Agathobacter sp.]
MKAKDLKLGSICYRAYNDMITSLKVVKLGLNADGDILINFHNDSRYTEAKAVNPEAEAIIFEESRVEPIYLS